jgi:hypothetical protein
LANRLRISANISDTDTRLSSVSKEGAGKKTACYFSGIENSKLPEKPGINPTFKYRTKSGFLFPELSTLKN